MTSSRVESVGALLREWRERRRITQEGLSELASVSPRHVSRVETGRAHPTAAMIMRFAEQLDVPMRATNTLLLAAGYAPYYTEYGSGDAPLATVLAGLRRLLDAHLPHPALLLDDHWDVVEANSAVDTLLVGCAPWLLEPPVNVVRLCLHDDGLAGRIVNRDEWAAHLFRQVRHRAARTGDPRHLALVEEVDAHLGEHPHPPCPDRGPVAVLELATDGGTARFFTTSARLEGPTDATLEGLHLETFLPAG